MKALRNTCCAIAEHLVSYAASFPPPTVPCAQLQLIDGDGRAEHSDGAADPGVVQLDHVEVAFHDESRVFRANRLADKIGASLVSLHTTCIRVNSTLTKRLQTKEVVIITVTTTTTNHNNNRERRPMLIMFARGRSKHHR